MKKPKIKLDSATIQAFFVHHVEKIVLVVVLGIMAWLVYAGYSLPGLEAGRTPSGLKQVSNTTRTFIDDPQRWTTDVAPERLVDEDLVKLVEDAQKDTVPNNYFLPQPLKLPDFPKLSPRKDPKIYPPINIEVEPVVGPLAVYVKMDEMDPLYPEPPDPADPAKKKPPVRKPPTRRPAAGVPGTEDPSGIMPEMGPARGRGGRGGRSSSRGGSRSMSSGMSSSSESFVEPDGGSAGGSMGMSGMPGMMGGGGIGATPGINAESILGFQTSDPMTIGRHTQAMVIKAVVPFEKQSEEYVNSLGSSLDYDYTGVRDQPWYLGFFVERAIVPADDLAADPLTLKYDPIPVKATLEEQVGSDKRAPTWAGVLTDVVDPAYLDEVLTHPAPPFMQRDVWRLLTHADVPLASQAMAGYDGAEGGLFPGAAPKEGAATDTPSDLPSFNPNRGFGDGYGGSGDGAMPSMPGTRGGGFNMPRSPGSSMMPRGPGGSVTMPRGPSGSSGSSGMSSSGGMGPYGGGGAGSSYDSYGAGRNVAPPKYKLVRFTDTTVEEGKFYRYRIKVLLNDPNHPRADIAAPTLASLDPPVRERIRTQEAADAKAGPDKRTYWVISEASEPSEVVSLPATRQYFVGSVEQPASVVIVDKKPKVANTQPKAKVLTNVWDPLKVVDVPAEVEVFRGSILNFIQDAKVIHPVTHEVIDLEKYNFQTNAIVADLSGGDVIPPIDRKNDKPLKAPGEMLIFDAAGNLHVQDETEDIDSFRRFLLPKEDENSKRPGVDGQTVGPDGAHPGGAYSDLLGGPDGEASGGVTMPRGGPGRGRSRP